MDEGKKEFIGRMGTFFLLVGLGTMWLFIVSDMGEATNFVFFLAAVICLVFGWHFKRISAPPPRAGGRFQGLRSFIQKQREASAKRAADRKAKAAKRK